LKRVAESFDQHGHWFSCREKSLLAKKYWLTTQGLSRSNFAREPSLDYSNGPLAAVAESA
jgi:hypothetical protein